MKHKDYKSNGGKLLRVDYEIKDNIIIDIKINGDFFIHPEDSINLIEENLKGKEVNSGIKDVENIIEKEGIKIIGFNVSDLKNILSENI